MFLLFFFLLLDDYVKSYTDYYKSFIVLFSLQFFLTAIPRYIIATQIKRKIQSRTIGFNTLVIGSNQRAYDLYKELENRKKSEGFFFKGFMLNFSSTNNTKFALVFLEDVFLMLNFIDIFNIYVL